MSTITLTKLELTSTTVTSIVAESLSKFENEIDIKIKIQRKVNTLFIKDDFKHKIVCFIGTPYTKSRTVLEYKHSCDYSPCLSTFIFDNYYRFQ